MNNTTTELTFKVGDRVDSQHGVSTITAIEVCAPGEKYGHKVEYATMAQKDAGMVVIDMANKHWARSDQFDVIDLEPKAKESTFAIEKGADNDYITLTLEKARVHELASGRVAIFFEEDECDRLGRFAEAIKIDRITSQQADRMASKYMDSEEALLENDGGLTANALLREQDKINRIHDTYGDGKGYEFEG
jgi:hypothetical protein